MIGYFCPIPDLHSLCNVGDNMLWLNLKTAEPALMPNPMCWSLSNSLVDNCLLKAKQYNTKLVWKKRFCRVRKHYKPLPITSKNKRPRWLFTLQQWFIQSSIRKTKLHQSDLLLANIISSSILKVEQTPQNNTFCEPQISWQPLTHIQRNVTTLKALYILCIGLHPSHRVCCRATVRGFLKQSGSSPVHSPAC